MAGAAVLLEEQEEERDRPNRSQEVSCSRTWLYRTQYRTQGNTLHDTIQIMTTQVPGDVL